MGALRYDRVILDRQTARRAADGSLIVRGRFARTGLQTYHNPDGSERIEYRSPAEVRASAATFEGKSFTDLHPGSMVTPSNWTQLARGHVQDISWVADGPDGEGWLEGDFHAKASDLIDQIERGDRSELSAGYFCDENPEAGEYKGQRYHCSQVGIVGNHVAALAPGNARAGRAARLILDDTGNQLPPGSDAPVNPGRETPMDEKATAEIAGLKAQADSANGRADALALEVEDLKSKLADATDPAKIDARVKARADLIDRARKLAGPEAVTDGSDREIKLRALEAVGVKLTDEQRTSDAYIDARLDAAIERQQELIDSGEITMRDVLDHGATEQTSTDPLDAVFAARRRYIDRRDGREE